MRQTLHSKWLQNCFMVPMLFVPKRQEKKNSYFQFKFRLRKSFQEFFWKANFFVVIHSTKEMTTTMEEQQCTFMKVLSNTARTYYFIHFFWMSNFFLPHFVILTRLRKQKINMSKASRLFHFKDMRGIKKSRNVLKS